MIEAGIYGRLASEVTSVGGRIYPKRLTQNVVYPALTYQVISDPRGHDHGGPDGTVQARVQVTAFSTSYLEMKTVLDAVRTALDGFTGEIGGVQVAAVFHAGGRDLLDSEVKPEVHYNPTDYMVQFTETGGG